MNVAAEDQTAPPPIHPRTRSMESWRARLGLLASRGETDGPRVAEARAALSWHRTRSFLIKEGIPDDRTDSLMDVLWPPPEAVAHSAEPSEPVEAPDTVAVTYVAEVAEAVAQ
ncbi:hypothetical protein [Mycolicibacterium setense]|uniref:hypothetical protein n=1 Tax=Mycolicibacterium setense TaxID=431269 RepID=UPI000AD8EE86|nr:hypothetical protein [Mycolicibacterium setense]